MSQDQKNNHGTALLENAEAPAVTTSAAIAGIPDAGVPDQRLAQAYRRWDRSMKELADVAQGMVAQYPGDRAARFFLAETMLASGCADLALDQYEWLRANAPAAELPRIVQGVEQCLADHHYFPPAYAKR
jgi:hypothetical protein